MELLLKNKLLPVITVMLAALVTACSTSVIEPEAVDNGYEFYPLRVGNYITYDAYEINYGATTSDTSRYLLREVVSDSFLGVDGDIIYVLDRFKKSGSNGVWVVDSVWHTRLSPSQAVRTENNRPYVNLVFPLAEGTSWNGFVYQEAPVVSESFRVYDYNQPDSINGQYFERTLKVHRAADSSLVGKNLQWEEYAAGVGLVRVYQDVYDIDLAENSRAGRRLNLNVVEYGRDAP
jgi:hypothetical protein